MDGKGEKDLEIPTEQERRAINGVSKETVPDRLNKTRKIDGSSTEKVMQLSEGSHVIKVSYDLKAGYGGVSEEAGKDLRKTLDSATKTANSLASAFRNLVLGTGGQAGQDIQAAFDSALETAQSAANTLYALLTSLLSNNIAYVRLFSSSLNITCEMSGA